jgi:lipopolysaccharide export LptBFGC system permease protein LptF
MIPGRTLHRLAAHVCSARSLQRIVEPAIADFQKEYADVGAHSRAKRAQVLFRGYVGVLEGIAMTLLSVSEENDRRALLRTVVWAAVATVSVSALIIAITIAAVPVFAPFYIALLTPMALPMALPIGVTIGIACGLCHREVSRSTRLVVVLSAICITAVSFASTAWVKPVTNQSFRQSVFDAIGGRGVVVKGLNEMSLSELHREARMAPRGDATHMPQRASWTYHLTFALPVAPLALTVLALVLIGRGAKRAIVMVTCVAYYGVLLAGEALVYEGLPPMAGAWMANVLFAFAAAYFVASRPSTIQGSFSPAQ